MGAPGRNAAREILDELRLAKDMREPYAVL
jgi:hypothetical protein